MNLFIWFLISITFESVTARRNETRVERRKHRKKKKNKSKIEENEQIIVAVSHDEVYPVEQSHFIIRSDSHTEDWEDQDECDNDRYDGGHEEGGHGSCDDHPIKLNQKKECQDPVYWHFCDHVCHSIYKDPTRMPHAYVGRFKCEVVLEQGYVPHDLLNEESCEEDGDYHESKFIDCYCKPEDHIAWVASLAILGTLFLAIKFAIHFVHIYRAKKKREKEEALAEQRSEIEKALTTLSEGAESKGLLN